MRASRWIILVMVVATTAAVVPMRRVVGPGDRLLMAVWGMPFEDLLFRDRFARGFEALHTGWSVDYQRHRDLTEKYNAWHVLRRGADVMRIRITDYHDFIAKGMILPLDEFIDDAEVGLSEAEQADFVPAIWEQLHVDGHVYALPSDNAQYGLYYNRVIFDEYDAAHPQEPIGHPSSEWTWEDLVRAGAALTVRGADGRIEQYGIGFDLWSWPFMAFFAQAGGELWDEGATTTLIDSNAGVEAMEYLAGLIPPDAPVRSPELAESAAGPAQLFKVGRLAMLMDGSWRAPNVELDAPQLDFGISALPHQKRAAVVSGSVLWAVSSHTEHPRMSWEMVKWLVSYEQSLAYWDTLRVAPPALVSVLESAGFAETRGIVTADGVVRVPAMPRERFEARAAWLRIAITPEAGTGEAPGFVPAAPYQADLERAIDSALVSVVRGKVGAREALRNAAGAVHEIIDRDRAARGLGAVVRETRH